MTLLVDADVMVYAIGFSADKEECSWEQNKAKIHDFMKHLCDNTHEDKYQLYLSPQEGNFRLKIFPDYKANRKSGHKPVFYDEIREHLIDKYKAIVTTGQEADDALGLNQKHNTIICTIDKDLNMVHGWHFNWRKWEEGLVWIGKDEAFLNFCLQCLTGDSVDNIPGLYRTTGQMATKKIKEPLFEQYKSSKVRWEYVQKVYEGYEEDLRTISKLLWIRHTYGTEEWMDALFNSV